ncbi:5-methylthioadenosine/S-adenosylhomocysteine deaminase 2, partial [Lachnellula arida]
SGIVLLHILNDQVIAKHMDVLVRVNYIVAIEDNIPQTEEDTVIDCSDTIISPGFIDTHRHLWQTQPKGRHGDDLLSDYLTRGYLAGSFYEASDVQLGELSDALESIDAGTTTIVDQMHIAYSPTYINAALEGLMASGVRVIFCPTPTRRVKQWQPDILMEEEQVPAWFLDTLQDIIRRQKFYNRRISLGLGFDSFELPQGEAEKIFLQMANENLYPAFDAVSSLSKYMLMGPDILLSHCHEMTSEEKSSILATGAHISSTPSTELQMGLGEPICFADGMAKVYSLGVDCHAATSSSLVAEARLALQFARGQRNQSAIDTKSTLSIKDKTIDAFNLITIKGAQAIGLRDKVGSIAVGTYADLVFWDKISLGMLAAAEHDPVAAIMHHSSSRDVESVMVNGTFRKHDGILLPVDLAGKPRNGKALREKYLKVGQELKSLLRTKNRPCKKS